jgi:tetratricopeptide (TPR) repeat protein
MGQFQLVQKPTAYLALEEAFRLYVSRRPNEACATCRTVANRYRERDPRSTSSRFLAESWIYELIGDHEVASGILEDLGRERGFETDIDRLIALVSLYEKAGTRERLEAAVNICRYLEQHYEDTEVLGRLALLYRRLGQVDAAIEHERRHLLAYRRSRHRPDLGDVISVASKRFVPIERLREIRLPEAPLPPGLGRRETAIATALHGDFEAAKAQLSDDGDLLDQKYRANLEDLSSPEPNANAIEGLVQVLRDDPTDLHVISRILDLEGREPSPLLEEPLRDPRTMAPVLETLESAVHTVPNDARLWRRLATLFRVQNGETAQAQRFTERAEALERSARERSRSIGRVLSAATYRFAGRIHGLIHEVWATRELASPGQGGILRRDDILGNVTDEMRGNIRSTFLAVREYAQAKFPHSTRDILEYNYGYKVTKEDEPSGGTSAGLPTALAFLSLFLQRPVSQELASTGVVVTDAHDVLTVRTVGDGEYKVDGAYHRNLRTILVPTGNRAMLERNPLVPRRSAMRSCGMWATSTRRRESCSEIWNSSSDVANWVPK